MDVKKFVREKRKAMLPSQQATTENHSALKDREFKTTSEENRFLRDTVRDLERMLLAMRQDVTRLGDEASEKANELQWLKENHSRPFKVDIFAKDPPGTEPPPPPTPPHATPEAITTEDAAVAELHARLESREAEVDTLRADVQALKGQLDAALADMFEASRNVVATTQVMPSPKVQPSPHVRSHSSECCCHCHHHVERTPTPIPAFTGNGTDMHLRRQLADALQRAYGLEERESMRPPSAPTPPPHGHRNGKGRESIRQKTRDAQDSADELDMSNRSGATSPAGSHAGSVRSAKGSAKDISKKSGHGDGSEKDADTKLQNYKLHERLAAIEALAADRLSEIQCLKNALGEMEAQRSAVHETDDASRKTAGTEAEIARLNDEDSAAMARMRQERDEAMRALLAMNTAPSASLEELQRELEEAKAKAGGVSEEAFKLMQLELQDAKLFASTIQSQLHHVAKELEETRVACDALKAADTTHKASGDDAWNEERGKFLDGARAFREQLDKSATELDESKSACAALQEKSAVDESRNQEEIKALQEQVDKMKAEAVVAAGKEKESADRDNEIARLRDALRESAARWEKQQKGLEEKVHKSDAARDEALKAMETKTALLRKEQERTSAALKALEKAKEEAVAEVTGERTRTTAEMDKCKKLQQDLDGITATHDAATEALRAEVKFLRNDNEHLKTRQMLA